MFLENQSFDSLFLTKFFIFFIKPPSPSFSCLFIIFQFLSNLTIFTP